MKPAALAIALAAAALPTLATPGSAVDAGPARADGFGRGVVEILGEEAALAEAVDAVVDRGGEIVGSGPGVLLAEISILDLGAVAAVGAIEVRVPVPVDVRPERSILPEFGPTVGEGVAITGADAWHDAGIDGSGVRIGVIDFFDTTYWDPAEHGPIPVAGVNARCLDQGSDCTADFFDGDDLGGEDHGVAVVEIIRDMAPGAEIFIGQASTISDYEALIDWFASKRVRIISRSLGSRYDGPGDGRGALDEIAARAVAKGMTWVNSGGNNAAGQYYRSPVRLVGDRVAFGPSGTDTFLQLQGCIALGGMRWANDWDVPAADRTDYDLFVWESPTGSPGTGEIIGSSRRDQRAGAAPIELVTGNACPDVGRSLYLEVQWLGGDVAGDVLEILDYGNGFARATQSAYSAAVSVVDADLAGVVSVGAIDPPDSGSIGHYSSQGPTNDGRIAPSVTAPSGFASSVYGGTFSGTSAAAPVVAGGAALLVDAGVAGDAAGLGDLIRNSTIDHGPAGPDNTYGYGEFRLPPPPNAGIDSSPTRYVPLDAPQRFLDTRPEVATGPDDLIGPTWAGEIRRLPVAGVGEVPQDARAVAVNVVTVRPDRRSYVQALPLWQAALGGYSNLNADGPGQNRANFGIIPIADDGTIALYDTAEGHLVVDVLGWFEAAGGSVRAGRFVELGTAQRLVDTRLGGGPVGSGTTISIPDPDGIPIGQVDALVLTVTAAKPTSVGWLQAFPADRPDVIGSTSTVNTSPGTNAASTAIVPIGGSGAAVHAFFGNGGTGHVIVDAIGYITSDAAPASPDGRYVAAAPARAFDSRPSGDPLDDGQTIVVDASAADGVDVPDGASAVMWNLTIVNATRLGFATGWPADATRPDTSSLNWTVAGEVRAAAAVTAVDRGRARFRVDDQGAPASGALGHFLVDVFGYFT